MQPALLIFHRTNKKVVYLRNNRTLGFTRAFGLALIASVAFGAATVTAQDGRSPLSQSREARDAIRQKSGAIGRVACAETQVQSPEQIKQKAWSKIQTKCVTSTMSLGTLPSDDLSLAYSICIGAALESCQSAIGVADPCRDLASCRAALGVP